MEILFMFYWLFKKYCLFSWRGKKVENFNKLNMRHKDNCRNR